MQQRHDCFSTHCLSAATASARPSFPPRQWIQCWQLLWWSPCRWWRQQDSESQEPHTCKLCDYWSGQCLHQIQGGKVVNRFNLLCKGSFKGAENKVLELCTGTVGHQEPHFSESFFLFKSYRLECKWSWYIPTQNPHFNLTINLLIVNWAVPLTKRRSYLNIKKTTFIVTGVSAKGNFNSTIIDYWSDKTASH